MADETTQQDEPAKAPQPIDSGASASEEPVEAPAMASDKGAGVILAQDGGPSAPQQSGNGLGQSLQQLLSPPHDPEMAGANYYIDRRAWVLALGVLGAIAFCTWLVEWVVGWNMPVDVPKVVVDATVFSKGQLELVNEVNRQLKAWLYLSHNYEILAMVMGATAAALTVLVGFIKEHTKSKMFLMAMSAALSVFIGTVNPGEKATRFLNSWRVLYAEVNSTNAKAKLETDDFSKLANALSTAESALSQKAEAPSPSPAPPPVQAPPTGQPK